jgi:hypothetical protein
LNVAISVKACETISPAQNARHQRPSEGASDAMAAPGPSAVTCDREGRYPPPFWRTAVDFPNGMAMGALGVSLG